MSAILCDIVEVWSSCQKEPSTKVPKNKPWTHKGFLAPSKLTVHMTKVHGQEELDLSKVYQQARKVDRSRQHKVGKASSSKKGQEASSAAAPETVDFFKTASVERVDGKLKCPQCHFSHQFMAKLKIHVECVHLKLRKFKCRFCAEDTVSAKAPSLQVIRGILLSF